jgi:hypothetical protein
MVFAHTNIRRVFLDFFLYDFIALRQRVRLPTEGSTAPWFDPGSLHNFFLFLPMARSAVGLGITFSTFTPSIVTFDHLGHLIILTFQEKLLDAVRRYFLGPPFGTPIWDPHLGPPFGTPIWDPHLGPPCSALLDATQRCSTLLDAA